MEDQNWFAIKITAEPHTSEAIEFALNELNSLGNEINNLGKQSHKDICIIGYFSELPDDESLQSQLKTSLQIYGFSDDSIKKIETKQIENQDWLAEWKKHWKPTETDKFIIAPPWENIERSEKIIIKIEPNMAFGTGTHETTKLCLKAIEKNYQSDMSFFDVGTGTGILSIAVAKIQEKKISKRGEILACDIDVDSIEIAKENAKLNDTEEIEFYVGSISEDSPVFDFVCANVTADIILPMLSQLVKKSIKVLLLSGILVEQENLVVSKLNELGIENYKTQVDGEWISITVKF